jgi:D-hydroxyproline dehydrogenase subunit gamma
MPDQITLVVNGSQVQVLSGTSVAAAVAIAGHACRISVTGEPRGPLCGMGICFECRVTINGIPHRRACQVFGEAGMDVRTEE